jgi:hypothetical protein
LFEEDSLNVSSGEMLEAKDKFRQTIYSNLYGTTYKYGTSTQNSNRNVDLPLDDDDDGVPVPIDPFARSNSTKPYVPPTVLNEDAILPFGKALDAPLR